MDVSSVMHNVSTITCSCRVHECNISCYLSYATEAPAEIC